MSDTDVFAGEQWAAQISSSLKGTTFGIVCLTYENMTAPWLLFESGAVFKALDAAKVVPYRLRLEYTEVEYPLALFQGVDADRDGTLKLIDSINKSRNSPLATERVERQFDKWWPDLEEAIGAISDESVKQPPRRDQRELLEEILELSRGIMRLTRGGDRSGPRWSKLESALADGDPDALEYITKSLNSLSNAELKEAADGRAFAGSPFVAMAARHLLTWRSVFSPEPQAPTKGQEGFPADSEHE